MARRLLVPVLRVGLVSLPGNQAHHARDVLRLGVGDEVELFTAAGLTGAAVIAEATAAGVVVDVREIGDARVGGGLELTIASAVPRAARGDWMIEKLSELGVARFVPLMTARSVVHPEGKNKIERWERLAAESAKQSRRAGVMRIEALAPLGDLLGRLSGSMAYLSTSANSVPLSSIFDPSSSSLTLLVGPEGGWSEAELALFAERDLTGITLGGTILRVETAAIAAAAVVAALAPRVPPRHPERSPDYP